MNKKFIVVALIAGGLAFAAGLVWLMQMRLNSGVDYPPYSSLRADPLGTMALFESLKKMPALTVKRDYSVDDHLPVEPDTVYLHLAAAPDELDEIPPELYSEINGFLGRGGRFVVTYQFSAMENILGDRKDQNPDKNAPADKPAAKKSRPGDSSTPTKKFPAARGAPDKSADEIPDVNLLDKWGVEIDSNALDVLDSVLSPVPVHNVSALALAPSLQWHSGLFFTGLDKSWKVIYSRGADPVVIERRFGSGSVVLVSDSYLLSNEALRADRHADFLAWLIGPGRQVVFDEAHLGVAETPGIALLIRQYHLAGLAAGLLLLAGLFVWKNTPSLVPPQPAEKVAGFVVGKDTAAGFVNLLRRNVTDGDILDACFAEWRKSSVAARPGAKLAEVQAVIDAEKSLPARCRNAVDAYQRIASILSKPTFSSAPPAVQPPILPL